MTAETRVLMLNCEFPPIGGGAATVTAYLLGEFENLPLRVTLVTASPDDVYRSEWYNERCRIDYLPVGKKGLHYWTIKELSRYACAAYRHVRNIHGAGERYDVCHAWFTLPAGAVAWLFRSLHPYVLSLCGSDVPGFSKRFGPLYATTGFVFRRIWKDAASVVPNSDQLAALARETAPRMNFEIIPNGVDAEEFRPAPDRKPERKILTVARLVPRKDVATVIRAAARLAREYDDVRLAIVGDGPQAGQLQALAKEEGIEGRVEFRLSVPRDKMADVYRDADVFAMTSLREGMSNTILEALASGLPLVVSQQAIAGVDMTAVRLVSPGDERGVADAVAYYLEDERARRSAALASRETAMKYTWARVARLFFDLYQRVAERNGKNR